MIDMFLKVFVYIRSENSKYIKILYRILCKRMSNFIYTYYYNEANFFNAAHAFLIFVKLIFARMHKIESLKCMRKWIHFRKNIQTYLIALITTILCKA